MKMRIPFGTMSITEKAKRLVNEALEANNNILSLPDDSLPKDKALYSIALIYAHFDNPERSYQKTLQYFSRLIKDFRAAIFLTMIPWYIRRISCMLAT